MQQIAEGDRSVTYITTQGKHSGAFYGIPPTGKSISTSAIRIDRVQERKIAEHWSVSDAAGSNAATSILNYQRFKNVLPALG